MKRSIEQITLDELIELADKWAIAVNTQKIAKMIVNNTQAIEDMLHRAFVEGAYNGAMGMCEHYDKKIMN